VWQALAAATVHGCEAADTVRHLGQAEASDGACQGHGDHPGCCGWKRHRGRVWRGPGEQHM